MIKTFHCADTQALFLGNEARRFKAIERAATRKLQMLHVAKALNDLASPSGNRLEALMKLLYLALRNISKRWTLPIRDWKAALNRFTIQFEERMPQL